MRWSWRPNAPIIFFSFRGVPCFGSLWWEDYFWANSQDSEFTWTYNPGFYDLYHCAESIACTPMGNGRYASTGKYCGDATDDGKPCIGGYDNEK